MALILLVCAVVLVALTAMGVMIGLLALLWRQVSSIAQVLGMLFEFLGGVPRRVQLPAAAAIPGLPAALHVGLRPHPLLQLRRPLANATAGVAGVAHPHRLRRGLPLISRHLLRRAEQYAKRSGLNII